MSAPMTFSEFADLVSYIAKFHSPTRFNGKGLIVKYIDPHFDMRTNAVFAITFRTFGGGAIELHTQNECRSLPTSLYERCMDALTT